MRGHAFAAPPPSDPLFPNAADLPVLFLDVEESRRQQTLIPQGGRQVEDYPAGCVLVIPSDAEIPVTRWVWSPARQAGNQKRVHLVIRSDVPGQRPRMIGSGIRGMLRVFSGGGRQTALTLENLDITGGRYGDAFRPDSLSRLDMRNVRISGGCNCMMLPTFPTVANLTGCDFGHGGFGDGQTHTVYVNYIKRIAVDRCRFHSPKTQGHALKTYAQSTVISHSHIASWLSEDDYDAGYGGNLPLLDIGAWGQSLVTDCVFTRLPPARDVCIDYRNRQWPKGYSSYAPPDWGTAAVPFGLVDNADQKNPYLFNHFVANNVFENGALPSGGVSGPIREHGGYALRNNGTAPWASGVTVPGQLQARPLGWSSRHERAVVWMWKNEVRGVPFDGWYLDRPYRYPMLTAPVRRSAERPEFSGLTGEIYEQLLGQA